MSDEVEALIHPGDDGKFWAEVVGLPGCFAQGDNYSKILANLRDAHELCSSVSSGAPLVPVVASLGIGEGATAGLLVSALCARGWLETAHLSSTHQLLQQSEGGAHLCVPLERDTLLNSGYRSALLKFLGAASDPV